MRDGDLSNKVTPRLALVFEGALAFCTDQVKYEKAISKSKWEDAIKYWVLNDLAARKILWLNYQRDVSMEVVTFLGGDLFASEISIWLDDEDLPIHRVYYTTPGQLGRMVSYRPDLACVYDTEASRWVMYGQKGRYLTSVDQIGEGL
jgi:hypothetical protein